MLPVKGSSVPGSISKPSLNVVVYRLAETTELISRVKSRIRCFIILDCKPLLVCVLINCFRNIPDFGYSKKPLIP